MDIWRSGASSANSPGRRLIQKDEWSAIWNSLRLTKREGEVVKLLFNGGTNEAVARELDIRPRTVRQYVEQIYQKLSVQDRVSLALLIVECRDTLRGSEAV